MATARTRARVAGNSNRRRRRRREGGGAKRRLGRRGRGIEGRGMPHREWPARRKTTANGDGDHGQTAATGGRAANLDGGGVDGVALDLANPTAATARCGGEPSGGRSGGKGGGGWVHSARAMGSTREFGEMGKKREGATAELK
uniref:Retrotransposon protein, putative, Ty3-gypsy subclass n=1 Tax=Oryza sativa subsp. japonica TaxID=39947 RepID=Q6ZBK8_ORYSJ|nr:hypothetical protein [Oryza sativa Japonica Group]